MSAHPSRTAALHRWFDAAQHRHSRRRYDGAVATAAQQAALSELCDGFHPFPDARVAFIADPAVDVFTGVIGAYGKISGAPHVLAVIIAQETDAAQAHAGYVGESAILEAAALGLDTCWVGGFFDPKKAARMVALDAGERIVAVSPVGTAVSDLSRMERAMRGMADARNRKDLDEIAPGHAEWPGWMQAAAACARIAPSAMNRQPWRLRVQDGDLIINRDNSRETPKVTKALDCGIAMLHAEVGAASEGVVGDWTMQSQDLGVARFSVREAE